MKVTQSSGFCETDMQKRQIHLQKGLITMPGMGGELVEGVGASVLFWINLFDKHRLWFELM